MILHRRRRRAVSCDGACVRRTRPRGAAFEPLLVSRGSITVEGVSLTVASLGPRWFEVVLIPETLERIVEPVAEALSQAVLRCRLFLPWSKVSLLMHTHTFGADGVRLASAADEECSPASGRNPVFEVAAS